MVTLMVLGSLIIVYFTDTLGISISYSMSLCQCLVALYYIINLHGIRNKVILSIFRRKVIKVSDIPPNLIIPLFIFCPS